MEKNNLTVEAGVASKLAFIVACFLLIMPSLFINNIIFGSYKYLKTGYFPKRPELNDLIIPGIFLICSFGLFYWSRRASRATGLDRPVFSRKFIKIYLTIFVSFVALNFFMGG